MTIITHNRKLRWGHFLRIYLVLPTGQVVTPSSSDCDEINPMLVGRE